MKGNTKGKPGKPHIKPPDLWIHHDQMELKALEKTQSGASVGGGDGPSGVPIAVTTLPRTSGGQDFESGDPHHHSNSLDKRTYVSSYIGKGKESSISIGLTLIKDVFLVINGLGTKQNKQKLLRFVLQCKFSYIPYFIFSSLLCLLILIQAVFPLTAVFTNLNKRGWCKSPISDLSLV
jgi:hypothetical protein